MRPARFIKFPYGTGWSQKSLDRGLDALFYAEWIAGNPLQSNIYLGDFYRIFKQNWQSPGSMQIKPERLIHHAKSSMTMKL